MANFTHTHTHTHPWGHNPRYPLNRKLGGPHSGLGASKGKNSWHSVRSKYKNKLHLHPYRLLRNISIEFRGHFYAIFRLKCAFMEKIHLTVLIKSAVNFAEHDKRTTRFSITKYYFVQSFHIRLHRRQSRSW